MITKPYLLQDTGGSCQYCIEKTMTDEEISNHANIDLPLRNGKWVLREAGNEWLMGAPYRNQCDKDKDRVHVVFDFAPKDGE